MNPPLDHPTPSPPRGMTLIEVMIALVVLSVGILAVGRMFPSGSRAQVQDHLVTAANNYAQERIEDLSTRTWSDTALSVGRHPTGTATESIGSGGQWKRFYSVSLLAAPLNNLKRIDVTVTYWGAGLASQRSVVATTYMRQ
jgi:prepilin-type N-terminal cleavage/methylation domain-containing protein